jgi:signal transduction histidine kinase
VSRIERLARRAGDTPRVDVELSGDLDDLGPSLDTALYRLAPESVTNALRHARHATLIRVSVAGDGHWVRLEVRDDGSGGSTDAGSSGYGLLGMAERAKLHGGTLLAGPAREGGWTVSAVLPRHGKAT